MSHFSELLVVPLQIPRSIWFLIIVGFAFIIITNQLSRRGKSTRRYSRGIRGVAIEPCPNLLSNGEFAFFQALERAVGRGYRIAIKVRLGDLIAVRGWDSESVTVRNKIQQKHVDFVICTVLRVQPVLVIELDDASHDSPDRIARDNSLDGMLEQAGIPVIHWPCQRKYDAGRLAAEIRTTIE